ncbi:hypothetical protein OA335_00265 [Prochlorococcus sp. AH-716-M18]|nr:hypothetical protein [Prochlorococcus sp. AH-716-M18]
MSIPFYDFPSSPIAIVGALSIAVAIKVFCCLSNISIRPSIKSLQNRNKP